MNIENYLKKLKKEYLKTEPSKELMASGWQVLQERIQRQERTKWNFLFALVTIVVLIGTSAGLVSAAKDTLPGDNLYPIKRFSENVVSAVSGSNTIKIENRAQEIVELSEKRESENKGKNKDAVKKTVEEYKKEIGKLDRSGKDSGNIEEKLEQHKKAFERAKAENDDFEKEIQEAIDADEKDRNSEDD